MQINNNNYSIVEILEMLKRRDLIVNSSYQRGSGLWPDGPSAYFVDTILEGYPFPKIYINEFLDRASRGVRKEIVDGQQRIGTISRFFNDEFPLRSDGVNNGKRFSELDRETQDKFLTYSVSVDVIRNAKSNEILQMFRRMNAYTLPLNEAEKRHSAYHGLFKWFVNTLSDETNEFFVEFGVFTPRQITRMSDSAFIADCILAIERGVISTSPKDLSGLYEKYDEVFDESSKYKEIITDTIQFISSDISEVRRSFMMKPYALHSLITALVHNRFGIDAIRIEWGVEPRGQFAADPRDACRKLLAMANAHEAKEVDGMFAKYVWGCLSTTDRKARRTARVASILRALGSNVPEAVDANLS